MPILAAKQKNTARCVFSFDFRLFCVILNLGRAQAACSSHKEMAKSAFSIKTQSKVTRAQGFSQSPSAKFLDRLLQVSISKHIFAALAKGFGRAAQAAMAVPAFFHAPYAMPLGWRDFCAISGFSLTVRAQETRATLAAFVRPEIQKVRIC